MNWINLHFNENIFMVIVVCLLQSCINKSNSCANQLENKILKAELSNHKKSFVLDKNSDEWEIMKLNEDVIGGRFNYEIEIDSSDEMLLNYNPVKNDDITDILKEEVISLAERFDEVDSNKIPKVGFQIIWPSTEKLNEEKLVKIICVLNQDIETVKHDIKKDIQIDSDKVDRLLQPRFSVFFS